MIWISCIAISYLIFILWMIIGWYHIPVFNPSKNKNPNTKITVIIVARNEENNIPRLFQSLKNQTLSKTNFEVILVDDHSEDATVSIANEWKEDHFTVLKQAENVTFLHKKQAIEQAIEAAQNDVIVLTDADCWMHKDWLMNFAVYFDENCPKAVLAPVQFSSHKSFFRQYQEMEFASLMATTASFVGLKKPLMANGANIAFLKSAFREVNGYQGENTTSGDDVFLIHKLKEKFGSNAIHFLKNKSSVLFTEAQATLKDFVQQRIRWTSKNKHYKDAATLAVGFYIYGINLFILLSWIFVAFKPSAYWLLLPFGMKIVTDFIYFAIYFKFSKQYHLLKYYLPIQILNTIYVVAIVFLSAFSSYEWKGRKWKI